MTRGSTITFRGRFWIAPLLLAGLLLLALAPLAHAAEPLAVEDLIRQGNDLRRKSKDTAAMPFFQRAYDLEPSPRTAAHLGLVEMSLGYFLQSERHLLEALASPRNPWVVRNRSDLEAALQQVRGSISTIDVSGTPTGAEVAVNGKVMGNLPLTQPVRVAEGVVQIAVRAPGYDEKSTSVKVAGGRAERLTVNLAPSAGQHAAAVRAGGAAGPAPRPDTGGSAVRKKTGGETLGTASKADASVPDEESSGAPPWVRPTAWVASGLAVSAFALSGYNYWRMQQNMDQFNTRKIAGTNENACSTARANKGEPGCEGLHSNATSAQRFALISLQAGGLLAAAAIVGFIWSADGGEAEHAASPGPRPYAYLGPDGGAAGLSLRF